MSELVVVTVPLPESVLGWLGSRYALKIWDQTTQISEDLLAEWVQPAHGILCSVGTPVTRKVIEAAPALRVISTISVGTDHIDLASAHHCGVQGIVQGWRRRAGRRGLRRCWRGAAQNGRPIEASIAPRLDLTFKRLSLGHLHTCFRIFVMEVRKG